MEPIKLRVSGNVLEIWQRPEFITSGTRGLPVEFVFDEQWEGLTKVATFRAGQRYVTVANPEGGTVVPWEVLVKPNEWLQIGVYGVNKAGTLVIPTLWIHVAPIYTGADPVGDPSMEPTLPVWQEIHNQVAAHCENKENPHGITAAQLNAAPAGFGLGETNSKSQAWNSISINGFFREKSTSPDGEWWHGLACKEYGAITTQLAFKPNDGVWIAAMRGRGTNNAWNPWEYLNPPMMPGVEYRTTERWRGKPVYTKLIDGGETVNGTSIDLQAYYGIIRTEGCILNPDGQPAYPLPNGQIAWLETVVDAGVINLYCNDSISDSGYTFCVQIWYVK